MPGIVVWTLKRIERLRRLAAQGLSARRIARRLSPPYHRLSPEAVRKAAERAGIPLLARGGPPKGNRNWLGKGQTSALSESRKVKQHTTKF
jgi:hypothetical protein